MKSNVLTNVHSQKKICSSFIKKRPIGLHFSGMLCQTNYQLMLCNIPDKQRPQLHCGNSLKFHIAHIFILQEELMSGNCQQVETILQAGLVLCQGYIPEKLTQNSHLKQCIAWGLGE